MKTVEFNNYVEREEYLWNEGSKVFTRETIEKLIREGFLTAPASTKYHGAYEGGLFDHSVQVMLCLKYLTQQNDLEWSGGDNDSSCIIVGLLHDLCKIDKYEKNADGVYIYSDKPVIKGHGIKSVVYAQKFGVPLTNEEIACITYHMGAFTDKAEWGNFTRAVEVYPNVLWTHHADMLASRVMGV